MNPECRKNKSWPKIGQNGPKMTQVGVYGNFHHYISLILHIPIAFNDSYLLMMVFYAGQKNWAQNGCFRSLYQFWLIGFF
jgi:hypothetical protein